VLPTHEENPVGKQIGGKQNIILKTLRLHDEAARSSDGGMANYQGQGCPMIDFQTIKSQFWYILEGLGMENDGIPIL
jgi:hypothetical protein